MDRKAYNLYLQIGFHFWIIKYILCVARLHDARVFSIYYHQFPIHMCTPPLFYFELTLLSSYLYLSLAGYGLLSHPLWLCSSSKIYPSSLAGPCFILASGLAPTAPHSCSLLSCSYLWQYRSQIIPLFADHLDHWLLLIPPDILFPTCQWLLFFHCLLDKIALYSQLVDLTVFVSASTFDCGRALKWQSLPSPLFLFLSFFNGHVVHHSLPHGFWVFSNCQFIKAKVVLVWLFSLLIDGKIVLWIIH